MNLKNLNFILFLLVIKIKYLIIKHPLIFIHFYFLVDKKREIRKKIDKINKKSKS